MIDRKNQRVETIPNALTSLANAYISIHTLNLKEVSLHFVVDITVVSVEILGEKRWYRTIY